VEGVVVKHREHGYRPRRRSWIKVRTRMTADAVVGGLIGPLNVPEALLLGLPDERGRLRVAARTGSLTLPARREGRRFPRPQPGRTVLPLCVLGRDLLQGPGQPSCGVPGGGDRHWPSG
jgi:hypothetical protein